MIRYCNRWKILTTVVLVVFFCINSFSSPVFLAERLQGSIQQEDSIRFFEEYTDSSETPVDVLGPMESCWPTYGQNNQHTGLSPYPTRDNPMTIKWKFEAEYLGFESSPVIDNDGILYIGARDTNLYAINPDGTERWRYDINGWCSDSPALAEDGTVYIGSWDHKLYAINPNGTLKWRFTSPGGIDSSPTIGDDGTIFFGVLGPGFDDGQIVAVNPNGTEKWHTDAGDYVYGSAAIGFDGTVYISSNDRYLYALNPENGSVIWKYRTGDVLSTVSIGDDGTIYGSCPDDYLYAFYPNGTLRWRTQIDYGSYGTPAIGPDGAIYIGGDYFYAVYPNGTMKWTYYGWEEHEYQVNAYGYVISSDGLIYFLANKGSGNGADLFVLNCDDGSLFYRRNIAPNGWLWSQPIIGNDGTIYVGSEFQTDETEGYLYAFGVVDSNHAPEKPAISGPRTGKPRQEHTYQFTVEDADDDEIFLFVDWDDGSNTSWLGPYKSDEIINLSHSWMTKGTYAIRACCMDEHEENGEWISYPVIMPRMVNNWLESLLTWLFNTLQDFLPFNFYS